MATDLAPWENAATDVAPWERPSTPEVASADPAVAPWEASPVAQAAPDSTTPVQPSQVDSSGGSISLKPIMAALTRLKDITKPVTPDIAFPRPAGESDNPVITFPKPTGAGVVSGIVRGLSNVATGLTTPENILIGGGLSSTPKIIQEAAGLIFGAQMAHDVPEKVQDAIKEPTIGGKAEKLTEGITEAAMALLAPHLGRPKTGGIARGETRPPSMSQETADAAAELKKLGGLPEGVPLTKEAQPMDAQTMDGLNLTREKLVNQLRRSSPGESDQIQARIDDVDAQLLRADRVAVAESAARVAGRAESPPPAEGEAPPVSTEGPPAEGGTASSFTQAVKERGTTEEPAAPTPKPKSFRQLMDENAAKQKAEDEAITKARVEGTEKYTPAIRLENGDVVKSRHANEGHGELSSLYPGEKVKHGFVNNETGRFMNVMEVAREQSPSKTTAPTTTAAETHTSQPGAGSETTEPKATPETPAPKEQPIANTVAEKPISMDEPTPDQVKDIKSASDSKEKKGFVKGLADQAREDIKKMGPGAANAEEFTQLREQAAREYSAIGASHLMEGKTGKTEWLDAMKDEYGIRDASIKEMNKIWRDSHEVVSDFEASQTGNGLRPKAQIETGIMGRIKQTLSDSVSKAKALSGYLSGMEKGSKLGAAARQNELMMASRWHEADKARISQDVQELIKSTLPPEERGRFTGRLSKILTTPFDPKGGRMLKGEFVSTADRMHQAVTNLVMAVNERAADVHRGEVIKDIAKTVNRTMDSPSVDLKIKSVLQRVLRDINLKKPGDARVAELEKTRDFLNRMQAEGKNVVMPQEVLKSLEALGKIPVSELPTASLEALQTKVRLLERLGRQKFATRARLWEAEKNMRMGEMIAGDASPLELDEAIRPQPGEKLTWREKFSNRLSKIFNAATEFDLGHLPEDVIFDWLQGKKGTYEGPLFDHVRTPTDAGYDAAQTRRAAAVDPLREIVKRNKLTDQDEEKIGLWAHLQQDGGEARAIATGVSQKTIDTLKESGLTKGQKEAYDYMRRTMDATLPDVQETMYDLYNIPVEPVKNYFPWMREYEIFKPESKILDAKTGQDISQDQLDTFGRIAGNFAQKGSSKLQRGFTIERLPGAQTPIRYDAFDVFAKHMYHVARLIEMQRTNKMIGEMLRSDAFGEKYGQYGQQLAQEWLTAVTTDGRGGNNVHRWDILDMARRAASRSMVFFRLTSNIKHLSAIPQAMVNAGSPMHWFRGLHGMMTEDGKAFLKNFPQVTERQAGDMSFAELQSHLVKDPDKLFPKTMALADRYGFILGKEIDALNSRATFVGRYLSNLEDAGKAPDLSAPVDQKAAANALAFMRRTVSSTLAKDVQPALGRGKGFGGNISIARTMNSFRQFALERYSLLRYDTPAAFKTGNYTRGIAVVAAALAAGLYETQIAGAVKSLFAKATGQKEEDKPKESWLHKLMMDTFTMVPYMNNVAAAAQFKETGIPIADSAVKAASAAHQVATAKTEEGKKAATISAAGSVASLIGVPGASVITDAAKGLLVDKKKMHKQVGQAAAQTKRQKFLLKYKR